MIFPMYILLTLSIGDFIEWAVASSAAVPWSEGLIHYLVWWAVDAPCAVYGAYRGFNSPLAIDPEVGSVKRDIPDIPWYLRRMAIVCLYGPLIFGSVFYEFHYIMVSVWASFMIYGMFIILFVSMLMLGVTIASLSIVVTYKSLCHQNYNWWWNSFCLGASGGLCMWLYSAYWLFMKEKYDVLSADFIYFLSMTLISICFSFMCGSISVLSSYLFVERIYNASSRGEFTKF